MKISVVKIGGAVLENQELLNSFLASFLVVENSPWLVHGGGKDTTKRAEQLGVESQFIDGRRVTSEDLLAVATEVYAGVNKRLVAQLTKNGRLALGLSGADLALIPSKKRSVSPVDYGMVGDPVEGELLPAFLDFVTTQKIIPVFSALSYDPQLGSLLNTNADTIAATLATKLAQKYEVELIMAFEQPGVMLDIKDPSSLIPFLNEEKIQELIADGTIVAGMLPKINNALEALKKGVKSVRITKFDQLNGGTVIQLT